MPEKTKSEKQKTVIKFNMYSIPTRQFAWRLGCRLNITLFSVTTCAKHLAVVRGGVAAFAPRCDVVGWHLGKFKVFAALRFVSS